MRFFLLCAVAFLLQLPSLAGASSAEQQIFEQLNQERRRAGLPALEWSELAAAAARKHARLLADHKELSHQFAGEPSLPERLGATGVRFTNAAENVALTEYIEDVHLALMNSPGHRANILSPKYNAAGIGVVEEKGRIFVAQDFIFRVPAYTEEQFGAAFAEELNRSRRSHGFSQMQARNDATLHHLACSTDGNAANLIGNVDAGYIVVFNSSEPHRLPEKIQSTVDSPQYHHMNFGVCFRPDKEHGYGNFWVVAVFGG
jgi:uncharacterized protein YkwD